MVLAHVNYIKCSTELSFYETLSKAVDFDVFQVDTREKTVDIERPGNVR